MFCIYCGKRIEHNGNFCIHCGKKIAKEESNTIKTYTEEKSKYIFRRDFFSYKNLNNGEKSLWQMSEDNYLILESKEEIECLMLTNENIRIQYIAKEYSNQNSFYEMVIPIYECLSFDYNDFEQDSIKLSIIGKFIKINILINLTNLELTDGLEIIGPSAISGTKKITSLVLPNTLYLIDECAFAGSGLIELIIPSSVKRISHSAFYSCYSLEKVTIEEGVEYIDDLVFEDCLKLEIVEIPNSIKHIGIGTFNNCGKLKYNSYQEFLYLGNTNNNFVILMGTIDKTKSVYNLHSETKIIAEVSFADCKNLNNITIHKNIIEIGNSAFKNCANLKRVVVEEGVQTIDSYAFYECTELSEVKLPKSIIYIGNQAFYGCEKIIFNKYDTGLYLGDEENQYRYFIKRENENIESCVIHSDTVLLACRAFGESYKLKEIEIPDGITYLGVNLFFWCDNLERIILPASIQRIEMYAFSDCSNLKEICFKGTKEQWETIDIHELELEKSKNINIIYNYQN